MIKRHEQWQPWKFRDRETFAICDALSVADSVKFAGSREGWSPSVNVVKQTCTPHHPALIEVNLSSAIRLCDSKWRFSVTGKSLMTAHFSWSPEIWSPNWICHEACKCFSMNGVTRDKVSRARRSFQLNNLNKYSIPIWKPTFSPAFTRHTDNTKLFSLETPKCL